MKDIDITFLHSELVRVSNWIEFADKKAGFLGVFYSAILGFALSKSETILQIPCLLEIYPLIGYLILLLFAFFLVRGLFFLFRAVLPDTSNLNTDHSMFFYGTVARKKIVDYLNEFEQMSQEKAKKEIVEQIYVNSCIADKKMSSIRESTRNIFLVISLLVIITFITM